MTSAARPKKVRLRYAPRSAIDKAVEAVRANGINVATITMGADGSIKLSAIEDAATRQETLFDALDKAGRL